MALFEKRVNLKPYEYPDLLKFRDAIRHSYWLHTEFSLSGDVQDWHARTEPHERNALKNTMLAISQIEVSVKTFWARIYDRMPKPEIAEVGMTFAESEVRHANAYSHLLDLLGLSGEFEKIHSIPAINDRIQYLQQAQDGMRSSDNRQFALTVLLFSAFVEHISLFSQFLIIMAFNKHRAAFKGVSNIVEATSKEEQIHGMFGVELVRILQHEYPDWFDSETEDAILRAVERAYHAEQHILDWIFERGELDYLPRYHVDEFLKHRFNNSLRSVGVQPLFRVDEQALAATRWFDEEMLATKENDFFNKRSITYSKKMKSFSEEELF
ncbi:MAG: ribonucleoside-diphosphate reductase subunit beta [Fimbriimonadales bacterium]|nr:MAG: ribonucleoside-diphosphate reductase subunit beta [Fimbriimonadales bacterium]GIV11336.1 MAG: ribonucleoside-diphosphate reductase subunit beta [Fimbriimonadales bacterium]